MPLSAAMMTHHTVQASRAAIIALLKARQAEMQAMIEAILARLA